MIASHLTVSVCLLYSLSLMYVSLSVVTLLLGRQVVVMSL